MRWRIPPVTEPWLSEWYGFAIKSDGKPVAALEYQAYEPMAPGVPQISADIRTYWPGIVNRVDLSSNYGNWGNRFAAVGLHRSGGV